VNGYTISTDPARLDRDAIHRYLSEESYWAAGIARETFERSVANSLPFGLYAPDGSQAGFARVVSDFAVYAWLGDVFVLDAHRERGLGVWLVETVLAHPDLQSLRTFTLKTADAHSLYARFGFVTATDPTRFMERHSPRRGDGAPPGAA
jgi:GNAT superfamily N-acetyltransferase